jgi:oligopeptide/dipeptide ABC transporter ATP-binding protein
MSDPGERAPLLEVRDLTVAFPTASGVGIAVNGASLTLAAGETLGIVGESGSGKTMLCRALLGLIPWPGAVAGGSILWQGCDLVAMTPRELRAVRGREISMIFQDPASALNPVFTIGAQITEPLRVHRGLSRAAARAEAIELLGRVGIPSPRERFDAYPHQLSGGMRQRAMIAIAISCRPALILADEPTTNLDVTIQDQILALLAELREEEGMAMVLVSHDLGVVAQNADKVMVMYSGSVMESAPARQLFASPRHPYTTALMRSLPSIHPEAARTPLPSIPGQPPSITDLPAGCSFAPRCAHARDACAAVDMARMQVGAGHETACPFIAEIADKP